MLLRQIRQYISCLLYTSKIEALPTITNAEKNYSLTAVLGEDGIYRFDFTGDGATLSPNTVYTVTYGDTSAQLTTGEGIVQSAVPVIDSDGKASTIITNTSETATNVYIISAYYNSCLLYTSRIHCAGISVDFINGNC